MEILDTDLTMISICGIRDTLRPGVKQAVQVCHNAGINVRMVTGDNFHTARTIALEAGIITEADLADGENQKYLCMEGGELMNAIGGRVEYKGEKVCTIENMDVLRLVDK